MFYCKTVCSWRKICTSNFSKRKKSRFSWKMIAQNIMRRCSKFWSRCGCLNLIWLVLRKYRGCSKTAKETRVYSNTLRIYRLVHIRQINLLKQIFEFCRCSWWWNVDPIWMYTRKGFYKLSPLRQTLYCSPPNKLSESPPNSFEVKLPHEFGSLT